MTLIPFNNQVENSHGLDFHVMFKDVSQLIQEFYENYNNFRDVSKNIDDLIFSQKKFNVLDKGYIRVVDYMGNDEAIVNAARQSYGKGTRKVSDDEKLLRHLFRHQHTSPFEMCEIKLEVMVPMDVWRQWIRHRTASANEYSTRYSEAIDEKKETTPSQWRSQSNSNKQGSGNYLDIEIGEELSQEEQYLHNIINKTYSNRLEKGVAREQARKDLPLCNYTKAFWKIDLYNLLHFLSLRMDSHAQEEIRAYANVIGNEIVAKWVPLTWKAFNDYDRRRFATIFSYQEKQLLKQLLIEKEKINFSNLDIPEDMTKREIDEFKTKLDKILNGENYVI